jgi:hypothetical protein
LQASLAETQRRTARDQADIQIDTARLQADQQNKEMDRQVKIAMNAENNLTQERIKTAELTVDEAKLQKEQSETAIQLNQATQRNLGD